MKLSTIFTATRRRWLAGMLALVCAIALSSCNPTQYKSQAAQIPQLVVSSTSDPKTFNSALSSEFPNVFGYIYEGLVAENGLTGVIEPALAQQWEISPDKRRIVFTLRENLKWSDGAPLTPDDVVFTYNDIYFNK